jgi:hypothetical protein
VGRSKCIVFPKKLAWTKNHEPLTLREILQNHHFEKNFYDEAGITISDLSSNEIKIVPKEKKGNIMILC